MAKVSTVASLIAWEEARRHIAKTFGLPGYVGYDWPEKIGINELAALQTVDTPEYLDAWQTALLKSNIPVTIEEYERRYQYNVPGRIFEHKVISGRDFAAYLKEQNEKPSRLVAAWFEAFGINEAIAEPKDKSVVDDGVKKGRRDKQINLICETAKGFEYDLLEIPEGGKALIKTECLKNAILFTDDGFKRAWAEANKRKLISMKDKEKYL